MTRVLQLAAALLLAVMSLECGGRPPGSPDDVPLPGPPPPSPPAPPLPVPPPPGSPVFVGAGDIAECGSSGTQATAALLDTIGGTIFTTGDNAYPNGTREEFQNCYHPTWGRHKGRTRPSPGNHDYNTPGATPYYEYFGSNAGPAGLGYYSFTVGEWLVVSLNSNISAGAGSAQASWLRQTLTASRAQCTVAYWHHPVFGSGPHGGNPHMREVWRILYELDADVVLTGHEHLYERFAPQDADGVSDATRGIRQFTVGTGGAVLHQFVVAHPNSEVRFSTHGVLKLTLGPTSFSWDFVSVSGPTDSGFAGCH